MSYLCFDEYIFNVLETLLQKNQEMRSNSIKPYVKTTQLKSFVKPQKPELK